jgi:ATP-dependent DNA ligase
MTHLALPGGGHYILRMLSRTSSPRFRRDPPADFITPCNPKLVSRPPAGPGWLHEIKHDGCRILARKQGERVTLWTRRAADYTDKLLAIAQAARSLRADEALIDGEAVVFHPDGRSDFRALLTKRGGARATLVAFDLLRLDREDLRLRPIEAWTLVERAFGQAASVTSKSVSFASPCCPMSRLTP